MIAAYLAILVHNHLPKPLIKTQTTYTDCIAVQKLYNVRSPHTRASSEFFPIISHVSQMEKNIQWIKSHPERTHNSTDWNSLEFGIAIVDKVASGDNSPLHTRTVTIYNIPYFDISDHLLSTTGTWAWIKDNRLTLTNISTINDQQNMKNYLSERDQMRAAPQRGHPPREQYWSTATTTFAAKSYKLDKATVKQRIFRLRQMYDKGWHGGNILKTLPYPTPPVECILCGNFETSQDHMMRKCPNRHLVQIRHHYISTIYIHIKKNRHLNPDPFLETIADLYLNTALNAHDGHQIWSGMHNNRIRTIIQNKILELEPEPSDAQLQKIKRLLIQIGSRLAALTMALWKKRSELISKSVATINKRIRNNTWHTNIFNQQQLIYNTPTDPPKSTQSKISTFIKFQPIPIIPKPTTSTRGNRNSIDPATHRKEQRRHNRSRRRLTSNKDSVRIIEVFETIQIQSSPNITSLLVTSPKPKTTKQRNAKTETVTHYKKRQKTNFITDQTTNKPQNDTQANLQYNEPPNSTNTHETHEQIQENKNTSSNRLSAAAYFSKKRTHPASNTNGESSQNSINNESAHSSSIHTHTQVIPCRRCPPNNEREGVG